MPERRGRSGYLAIGLLGLVVVVAGVVFTRQSQHAAKEREAAIDEKSPAGMVAKAVAAGDAKALAVLYERVMKRYEQTPAALNDAEGSQWVETLNALRTGYPKFSAYGKASTLPIATRILGRFSIEPAPQSWIKALPPVHDILTAGLADSALNVRLASLGEVAQLWMWLPGRSIMPVEEGVLANWKEAFRAPVVARLAEPQPILRAAAVACLAALPIDSAAAPAAAYLADPDPDVRRQVLVAFAARRNLLTDEAILQHLGDHDPRIPPVVEQVLIARGLSKEQIGLGGLIVHNKPELRESVIPLVANRTDIDPVIWLVRLSHDEVDTVRLKAVAALASHNSREARRRLAEMAIGDPSAEVKKAASQIIVAGEETASLPPLPGSTSLTPKAN